MRLPLQRIRVPLLGFEHSTSDTHMTMGLDLWDGAHHIIVMGGDLRRRSAAMAQLEAWVPVPMSKVYRLPPDIGSADAYVAAVRRAFPLDRSLTWGQVWDVHIDWVDARRRVLVVWPEIAVGVGAEADFAASVLSSYVTELFFCQEERVRKDRPWFRLLASVNGDVSAVIASLCIYYGRDPEDGRSDAEVVAEYVRVVEV